MNLIIKTVIILAVFIQVQESMAWDVVYDPTQAGNMATQLAKTMEQLEHGRQQIEQANRMLNYMGDPKQASFEIIRQLGTQLNPFDYEKEYKKLETNKEEDKKLYDKKLKDRDKTGKEILRDKESHRASELQAKEYQAMKQVEGKTKDRRMILEERRRKIEAMARDSKTDSMLVQKLNIELASIDSELKQLDALDAKSGNQVIVRNAMNEDKKRKEDKDADEEFLHKLEEDEKEWLKLGRNFTRERSHE